MSTKKLRARALSATTALALLASTAGLAWMVPVASAVGPAVTTDAATSITATSATLNGTNGDTDATGSAFWVSTSTFTPSAGPSPVLPANVYSTGDLGAAASSSALSAALSSAVIPAGLLPITPNTTYYYTAWVNVGGTWTPGAVVNFTTLPNAPTITGISPLTGTTTGGTIVTVTGTNLTGATAVTFGATPATGVVVNSDTSVTATAPAGTGAVDVTITTAGGTSATSSADVFTYTPVPPLAPVISGISVSGITTTSATVSWTTDLPATSQVAYGTTTGYGSTSTYNSTASTTHSVVLTSLNEGTVYHFAVSSGNVTATTTSTDSTFVTLSTGSSTPLAINGIDSVDTSGVADGTFSNGWQYVIHFTIPDNENAFRIQFTNWSGSAGSFATANNIRVSTPQGSNASTTSSGVMVTGTNTYSDWIYLTGDSSTATPGRQVDVTVEVRIPLGTTPGSYTTSFVANTTPSTATSTTP